MGLGGSEGWWILMASLGNESEVLWRSTEVLDVHVGESSTEI